MESLDTVGKLRYINNVISLEPLEAQATLQAPILPVAMPALRKRISSRGIPVMNGPQYTSNNPVDNQISVPLSPSWVSLRQILEGLNGGRGR